jgi:succinate dehydrogenase / fumarate reductase iron-sulfur subunit
MSKNINLTLKVWRQKGTNDKGHFEVYKANEISTDMSFLETVARVFAVCAGQ